MAPCNPAMRLLHRRPRCFLTLVNAMKIEAGQENNRIGQG
ncbi:hypothetical protein NSU_3780 [Novosphingobium pentaromativorans US6-1]|uniref:Uncharacterized protein n=1 Tax=Novosphingobium pentaromativorans US6-1 TaxID=1088721 RepID=G6EHF9_9SPHN|nr:hypothetical protein NSU_3780 [Novosphingobium pentaromativorans US6-1]